MTRLNPLLVSGALSCLLAATLLHCRPVYAQTNSGFADLGIPITKTKLMATIAGPAIGQPDKEMLYFDFAQTGSTLFLVAVDPETGEARQFKAPIGAGAWALTRGPDEKIYLGTWESGYILKFDPQQPEKGLQNLGKPSPSETYIWQFATGKDGKLYGCTYPNAKLVSFDPKTGASADLGRMDAKQMYSRSVAGGPDGKIYTGIGYGQANIVAYDPATGRHESILPPEFHKELSAAVHLGRDGQVYARCGSQSFRIEGLKLVPIQAAEVADSAPISLRDGRIVTVGEVTATNGSFTLSDPKTHRKVSRTFSYQSDGSSLFVVGVGPDTKIYGSSVLPLEMFVHDPVAQQNTHLGNPTPVDGELYSIQAWSNLLFVCAYPGSYLSVYDPAKPFAFGTKPGDNPRGLGNIGDGHLRPRAMIPGPSERLYIGSCPPYGELGGALAVFDPKSLKVVENYRNIVTNQSVISLAYDPASGLIFGGSSIVGGGGSTPTESQGCFFAFDPAQKKQVFEQVLVPGVAGYPAMCACGGKIYVAAAAKLLEFDPGTRRVLRTISLPGPVLDISLGVTRTGLVCGLTRSHVFAVDPREGAIIFSQKSPVPIVCGFGLTDEAVYFGSEAHLWRFSLPRTTSTGAQ